jgi:hypothetical protein
MKNVTAGFAGSASRFSIPSISRIVGRAVFPVLLCLQGSAQDTAPASIAGRVIRAAYDLPSGGTNIPDVAAYDANTFRMVAGAHTGLTGTYEFTKTGTNTSLTMLYYLYSGVPYARSNYAVYVTPQSASFAATTFLNGTPTQTRTGHSDEVLFSYIAIKGTNLEVSWLGGQPPYRVEVSTNLVPGSWQLFQNVQTNLIEMPANVSPCCFRVQGLSAN